MNKKLPPFQKFSLLINGNTGLIVFGILIFGIIMSYNAVEKIDIEELTYLNKETLIGKGKIVAVFEASYSEEEEVTSYGYDYVFFSPIGDLNWTSYDNQRLYKAGDAVEIEYSSIRPSVNRISGMSNSTDDSYFGILLFIGVTLISLICLIVYFVKGLRKIKIISNGTIVEGLLFNKIETNTEVNEKRVYKMIFRYMANDGKVYDTIVKTHKTSKLEDEHSEKIIYHTKNPNQAVVVDSLPWSLPQYIKNEWR